MSFAIQDTTIAQTMNVVHYGMPQFVSNTVQGTPGQINTTLNNNVTTLSLASPINSLIVSPPFIFTGATQAPAINYVLTCVSTDGTIDWRAPAGGGAGVSSITGTANQITASASVGAVTLSLPALVNLTNVNISGLSASQAVVTNGTKNLVSLPYTSSNTASSLMQRDSGGNFAAATANLTGIVLTTGATNGYVLTSNAGGTATWQTVPTSGIQTINGTAGQISAATVGGTTTVALVNTAVTAGSYTNANITVDAQGRITTASNGSGGTSGVSSITGTANQITASASTGAVTLSLPSMVNLTNVNVSGLTASQVVATDGTKNLVSIPYATGDVGNSLAYRNGNGDINFNTMYCATASVSSLTANQAVVSNGAQRLASLPYDSANTASSLVERDGSGNFAAGTVTLNGLVIPTGATNGYVLTSNAGGTATWQAAGGGTSGVSSITGTANQITASASTGAVTLSLPNTVDINTLNLSSLTASQAVVTDANKNLISLPYSSTPAANSLVERDANGNIQTKNLITNAIVIDNLAGGTRTLTNSSPRTIIIGGPSASAPYHIVLPAYTGLTFGQSYEIVNNSIATCLVYDSANVLNATMPADSMLTIEATSQNEPYTSVDSWYYFWSLQPNQIPSANGLNMYNDFQALTTYTTNTHTLDMVDGTTGNTTYMSLALSSIPAQNSVLEISGTGGTAGFNTLNNLVNTGQQVVATNGTNNLVNLNLANTTVTAGSYTSANITVDAQGRITAAANGSGGGTSGVSSITGTANQITASASTGAVTLSLPTTVDINTLNLSSLTASQAVVTDANKNLVSLLYDNGPSANSLVQRNSFANVLCTNIATGAISINNTAGGSTIIGASSSRIIYISGDAPSSPYSIYLPDVTTLPFGFTYEISNFSGNAVYVLTNTGGTLVTMSFDSRIVIEAIPLTAPYTTTNGWSYYYLLQPNQVSRGIGLSLINGARITTSGISTNVLNLTDTNVASLYYGLTLSSIPAVNTVLSNTTAGGTGGFKTLNTLVNTGQQVVATNGINNLVNLNLADSGVTGGTYANPASITVNSSGIITSILAGNGGVSAIQGTTNQIAVSDTTGAVTLSLPTTVNLNSVNVSSLTASQVVATDNVDNLISLPYASANTASSLVYRDAGGASAFVTLTTDAATITGLIPSQVVATDANQTLVSLPYTSDNIASSLVYRDENNAIVVGPLAYQNETVNTFEPSASWELLASGEGCVFSNPDIDGTIGILPDATTLTNGRKQSVYNISAIRSTTVRTKNSANSWILNPGAKLELILVDNTTADGIWNTTYLLNDGTTADDTALTVSNKVITPELQVTTAPTDGYVLTSDDAGNATWSALNSGGTFTPTLLIGGTSGGITYTTQSGYYSVTGNVCTFSINLVTSSINGLTGNVAIDGLPVTAVNITYSPVSIFTNKVTFVGYLSGAIQDTNSQINVYQCQSGSLSIINDTQIQDTSEYYLSGSFFV